MKINSVFIADDDSDDNEMLREALQTIAPLVESHIVHDGKELMKLLESLLPDLVFLDLDMPCKNGLECLVEIRTNPHTRHLPVVIVSSTSRTVNIQTAYEMGADLFFIKPTTYGEILRSLTAILQLDWSDRKAITNQQCVDDRFLAFT